MRDFPRLRPVTEAEELGRGGRLRGGAAGELVAAAYAAESAHGPRLAHGLSLADLAHAVALVEGGDLAGDDARAPLRGLLEPHAIPGGEFPWDRRSATRSTRARRSWSGASAARRPAGCARFACKPACSGVRPQFLHPTPFENPICFVDSQTLFTGEHTWAGTPHTT
jgi:hypothetical protein